jgi:hypothetical protein
MGIESKNKVGIDDTSILSTTTGGKFLPSNYKGTWLQEKKTDERMKCRVCRVLPCLQQTLEKSF